MGFIKGLGSFAGKVAGGIVGGAIEIIGDVTDSDFIKEVGKGVNQVSSRSGELLGSLAEGTVYTVTGIISDDDYLKDKGKSQFIDATVDTITGVANGVVTVGKKGIDTAGAILSGDTEKAIECGKDLVKIVAVSALSIGVVDIIDGLDVVDILDGTDHLAFSDGIDIDNTVDADFDDVGIENPNMHSVTPHWRTLSDGREIWIDGEGDTSVNTGDGWIQHNPNYKSI